MAVQPEDVSSVHQRGRRLTRGWLWLARWPSFLIAEPDVSKPLTYTVEDRRSLNPGSFVYTLEYHIPGEMDGTATFTTHDGIRTTVVGPVRVDAMIQGDYYSTTDTVFYEPMNVTKGQLTVRYRFRK